MTLATCGKPNCGWEVDFTSPAAADRGLAIHDHRRHGGPPVPVAASSQPLRRPVNPVPQMAGADWWAQAVAAVRAARDTGREFTIYGALRDAGVGDPPAHQTTLGRFTTDVARLLDLELVRFDRSERPGTKRSSAGVWRGKNVPPAVQRNDGSATA